MTRARLRVELTKMLARNASARVDHIRRIILDGIDAQARKLLRALEADEKVRAEGFYHPNASKFEMLGGEPAAKDLIRQSEHHRERGLILEAAE